MFYKFLSLVLFLSSSLSFATYIPPSDSLTVGGRVFTNLSTLLALGIHTSAGGYGTFRLPAASAGYTPSGSNRFHVMAIQNIDGAGNCNLGYGDNDNGISGTAPTNFHYMYVAANAGAIVDQLSSTNGFQTSIDFFVPNGKFPFVFCSTGSSVIIFGIETP